MSHPVKLPDKRTMAYELLQLIAILGELPSHQLTRLPGGDRYKESEKAEAYPYILP